jgi:dihydroorotase
MQENNIIKIYGLADLNILPKDGKISDQTLQALADKMYKNGVIIAGFSQIEPLLFNDLQFTLFESLMKNKPKTLFLSIISGVTEDGKLSELGSLSDRADAIYVRTDLDRNILRRIYEYAKMKNKPVICHVIDNQLAGGGVANDTENAFHFGLPTRHPLGERIGVSIAIEMSKFFNVETLIRGVTDIEALKTVVSAKQNGAKIYLEVSLYHLIFDDSQYANFNNYAKIEPPFQDQNGQKFMLDLLKNGDIDILTSLHHNISESEKNGSFKESKYGVSSLDAILPIYYTLFVKTGYITLERLTELTSKNIFKFLQFRPSLNKKIDFDISESAFTEVKDKKSLFFGQKFSGKVILN